MFLDLRKAYDILEYGLILQTLEGYGTGPKLCDVLVDLWDNQEVVTI